VESFGVTANAPINGEFKSTCCLEYLSTNDILVLSPVCVEVVCYLYTNFRQPLVLYQ
jgi:hypothetical protein